MMALENDSEVADALHHFLMDQALAYMQRGRVLNDCTDAKLMEVWVSAFERWFGQRSTQTGRCMDDAAAEIRLRGLHVPYDRVRAKVDKLRQGASGSLAADEIKEKIDEMLTKRRRTQG